MAPILAVRDLVKIYRAAEDEPPALGGVTLSVEPGEFLAIMGPSGSGKSTLMNILGCLDQPTYGTYVLDGVDVSSLDDDQLAEIRATRIGFVFQSFNLLARSTVMRNVVLPMIYTKVPVRDREERAAAALTAVGLDENTWYHKSNELSGGQMQRVAIARALVNDPAIVLADEPTGNLDTRTGEIILDTFRKLQAQGRTIVLITHENSVAAHADRAVHLRDGVLVDEETAFTGTLTGGRWCVMSPYDLFNETFLSLTNNKVRSTLTILGIVVGIASVILMVSIGQGSQSAIEKSIQSAGSNLVMVSPGGGGFNPGGGGGGRRATLTAKDVKAIQDLPGIAAVAPEASGQYTVATPGASTTLRATGVTAAYSAVKSIETSVGAFFSEEDVRASRKVAVIGPTVVSDLFGEGVDPTGAELRINGMKFTILGVTKSKGGTAFGNADEVIYIPLTTLQRFLAGNENISTINVEAKSAEIMSTLQQQITDTLVVSRNVKDPAEPDFRVLSQSDILQTASTITGTFTVLLASIAGISLVVGGIGIMNMMLTTVTERTREIGLRKAIGARPADITSQFLAEAITLTVLGGVIGIALGWGASLIVTATGLMTTEVSWNAVALAVGVCAGIGIVFGYYPARRAAKLDPIEALRYQ